uniref:Uncharacterized protein n=1 Tax=Arundo donax TaxID=35708 RepID=A0A0A9ENB4_ARUDO
MVQGQKIKLTNSHIPIQIQLTENYIVLQLRPCDRTRNIILLAPYIIRAHAKSHHFNQICYYHNFENQSDQEVRTNMNSPGSMQKNVSFTA